MRDRFGEIIDGGVVDKDRAKGEGVVGYRFAWRRCTGGDGENDSAIHESRGVDVVHRSDCGNNK